MLSLSLSRYRHRHGSACRHKYGNDRVAEKRKSRGLTREKLSELAGVSVQFIADIEKGRKSMTVATLRRIASALGVTTDYIVNGIGSFPKTNTSTPCSPLFRPIIRNKPKGS